MDAFKTKGITCAQSIEEAVKNADLVISCLFDDTSLLDMIIGEYGVLHCLPEHTCYISTETILPKTVLHIWKSFKENQKQYLPAAILGGPNEVSSGKATLFTSGNSNANQKFEHIFKLFTEQIFYMGDQPDWAMVMKIAMNYTYTANLELFSKLYVFAEKHGIPAEYIQKTLYTVFLLPGYRECINKIHHRNYSPVNFAVTGGNKDLQVFQQAFHDVGAVPRIGQLLGERFASAAKSNLADQDWTAINEVIRKESGLDNHHE